MAEAIVTTHVTLTATVEVPSDETDICRRWDILHYENGEMVYETSEWRLEPDGALVATPWGFVQR